MTSDRRPCDESAPAPAQCWSRRQRHSRVPCAPPICPCRCRPPPSLLLPPVLHTMAPLSYCPLEAQQQCLLLTTPDRRLFASHISPSAAVLSGHCQAGISPKNSSPGPRDCSSIWPAPSSIGRGTSVKRLVIEPSDMHPAARGKMH